MAGLVLVGLIATAIVSALLMIVWGLSLSEIMEMGQTGSMNFSTGLTRALLAVQHLFTFIIPAIIFGLVIYRSKMLTGMDLSKKPGWATAILGIFLLLAAYPLVNLSFLVNEAMPLPEWANQFEDQAADTLKAILEMNSPLIFIINLIIIAILPGIGEELLFRGVLQKQMGLMLKNPIIAIWISAIIFSAIHLQFEGFLPRVALGAVLGYLYYWTGNLWVPIRISSRPR
jgi:membrane protease YdiL (CAAX protease family)